MVDSRDTAVHNCECRFCSGTPMVLTISYEIAEAAGLVADAKKDRVTIKPTDTIFVVEGVRAVACVRRIRRTLARMCGCWVDKKFRKSGIGTLLVAARLDFIKNHTGVRAIDTYAFNSRLYRELGFEERQSYKIGTTLLRLLVDR